MPVRRDGRALLAVGVAVDAPGGPPRAARACDRWHVLRALARRRRAAPHQAFCCGAPACTSSRSCCSSSSSSRAQDARLVGRRRSCGPSDPRRHRAGPSRPAASESRIVTDATDDAAPRDARSRHPWRAVDRGIVARRRRRPRRHAFLVKVVGGSSEPTDETTLTQSSSAVLHNVTSIPVSVYDHVGVRSSSPPLVEPRVVPGNTTLDSGHATAPGSRRALRGHGVLLVLRGGTVGTDRRAVDGSGRSRPLRHVLDRRLTSHRARRRSPSTRRPTRAADVVFRAYEVKSDVPTTDGYAPLMPLPARASRSCARSTRRSSTRSSTSATTSSSSRAVQPADLVGTHARADRRALSDPTNPVTQAIVALGELPDRRDLRAPTASDPRRCAPQAASPPQTPRFASRRRSARLALRDVAALELGRAAPDTVRLSDPQRVLQAVLAHRARRADRLGVTLSRHAVVLALRDRRREEQLRLRPLARSVPLPLLRHDCHRPTPRSRALLPRRDTVLMPRRLDKASEQAFSIGTRDPRYPRAWTPQRSSVAPRVLFIAGKGGVGKSTTTAVVAVLAARLGMRVLVVELEGRSELPRALGLEGALDWDERIAIEDPSGGVGHRAADPPRRRPSRVAARTLARCGRAAASDHRRARGRLLRDSWHPRGPRARQAEGTRAIRRVRPHRCGRTRDRPCDHTAHLACGARRRGARRPGPRATPKRSSSCWRTQRGAVSSSSRCPASSPSTRRSRPPTRSRTARASRCRAWWSTSTARPTAPWPRPSAAHDVAELAVEVADAVEAARRFELERDQVAACRGGSARRRRCRSPSCRSPSSTSGRLGPEEVARLADHLAAGIDGFGEGVVTGVLSTRDGHAGRRGLRCGRSRQDHGRRRRRASASPGAGRGCASSRSIPPGGSRARSGSTRRATCPSRSPASGRARCTPSSSTPLPHSTRSSVRHAANDAQADAIRRNPLYRSLASALGGTQEYMAMERLYELHATDAYDVVVVDTPPTRNALELLDAPERLLRFLATASCAPSSRPTRLSLRAASAATTRAPAGHRGGRRRRARRRRGLVLPGVRRHAGGVRRARRRRSRRCSSRRVDRLRARDDAERRRPRRGGVVHLAPRSRGVTPAPRC